MATATCWKLPAWGWRQYRVPYVVLAAVHLATALAFLGGRAAGTSAAAYGLPLDDAWIHLVYSRSFAHFEGLAYNPGVPECGATSPLWVLLQTPLYWLAPLWGGEVTYGVKVLGVALGWLGSVAAFRLIARLTGSAASAWGAALLLALDPSLAFARVSGMEVALAVAVPLWFAWSVAEGSLLGAALALALAPLTRPEHALFSLCGGVVLAVAVYARPGGARRRDWLYAFAPALLTAGAWVTFCLAVSGRPLPNTYYVKHVAHGVWADNSLPRVAEMIARVPWMALGTGALLAVAGMATLWRTAPRPRTRADVFLRALVGAYPLVFGLALGTTHDLVQAAPFYWARYLMPAVAWLAVLVGCGAGAGVDFLRARGHARIVGAGVAVVALVALARVPARFVDAVGTYSWNCQNIEEVQVALGRWAAAHTRPGEWIASDDAGAIRYFSGRPVLDLMGLNSARVLRDGRVAALIATQPAWVIVNAALFPNLEPDPRFVRVHSARAAHYTLCDCPNPEVVAYKVVAPLAR